MPVDTILLTSAGFVRQMCPPVFHLGDLGIRIIGMFPFVVGTLVRSLPIQLRQIFLRRRFNSHWPWRVWSKTRYSSLPYPVSRSIAWPHSLPASSHLLRSSFHQLIRGWPALAASM